MARADILGRVAVRASRVHAACEGTHNRHQGHHACPYAVQLQSMLRALGCPTVLCRDLNASH